MKHLLPNEAWAWLQAEHARGPAAGQEEPLFPGVRMETGSLYVGRPLGVQNIPCYEYPGLRPEPVRFAAAVQTGAGGTERPILLAWESM